ncbi:competence/damage-inducible protein A [Bacillus lacus]|uniref:Putative competence-damage inducible protein n=1 Tax=Metabacillus lacus TaxID=1983721 RepID=A0A7X2IVQ5_9BACI|nr:competence/damage-inducible protein A [Metabacillus lacus]MRX70666.1 competence/damage-inducible protein A [Metabacillus lacus]
METKAEIIAVGSELLLGQIANTNAQFLSKQLAELGINVYYHTVVGDNTERLKEAVKNAQSRSNIIVFTGGLGPTKDDLTKDTIATILDTELVTDLEAMSYIEDYFSRTKRHMTDNNKKQALVIKGADVLKNEFGMAPGMALTAGDKYYMLLPGPPSEMNPMFLNYGKGWFLEMFGIQEKIISRVLRYFGIGESQLETDIEDLIDSQKNPTIAPLASNGEVTLRLTARHESETAAIQLLNELEEKINKRAGKYFYGYDNTTLQQEFMHKMMERNLTISAAESLTGGLFSEQLTAESGTSKVLMGSIVCYTNEVKSNLLKVAEKTLENDGAVSEQCAIEMAENIRNLTNSDYGISFTGVAGPSMMEGHPVGTVYMAIARRDHPTESHFLQLAGSRDGIRKRTVKYGLHHLLNLLNSH